MSVSVSEKATTTQATIAGQIVNMRFLALRALSKMYHPDERRFVFRVVRDGLTTRREGINRRYTAISIIGLAHEDAEHVALVFGGDERKAVCDSLLHDVGQVENLGDAALTLWAAEEIGHTRPDAARQRLEALLECNPTPPTVELSWALVALCLNARDDGGIKLRDRVAAELMAAFRERSNIFPHRIGTSGLLRRHVVCFADLVYPIHALSEYHRVSGRDKPLDIATRCGDHMCRNLGRDGQWWWHHDVRSGRVLEHYPVYAVHQDAMAPMALFALAHAGGPDHRRSIERGLDWLRSAPELKGESLIDAQAGLIWRKTARREPRKLVRRLQAAVSRLHPALRMPGTNLVFPPGVIDYESRPYHMGWLLYAWPAWRAAEWDNRNAAP